MKWRRSAVSLGMALVAAFGAALNGACESSEPVKAKEVKPLVVRDWHEILDYGLTPEGNCRHCSSAIPGRFEQFDGAFGARRIPIRMIAAA